MPTDRQDRWQHVDRVKQLDTLLHLDIHMRYTMTHTYTCVTHAFRMTKPAGDARLKGREQSKRANK